MTNSNTNKAEAHSSCHNAPVSVIHGGEGTSYYRCGTCHKPCDTATPNKAEPCHRCLGAKRVPMPLDDELTEDCPDCHGTGFTPPADTPAAEYLKAHEPYEGSSVDFGSHRKPKHPQPEPTAESAEHSGLDCKICWILEGYRLRNEQFGKYDNQPKAHAAIQALLDSAKAEARLDESLKYPQPLYEQGFRDGAAEGRREEVEHLMQWNGSFIHARCGLRIDGILHRSVLEDRLAELKGDTK